MLNCQNTHLKSDGAPKGMQDVIAEAKTLELAQKANKLITDSTQGLEEQVNWVSHRQMKLKREAGMCHWCGDQRRPHPWNLCPAKGKACPKCGINDYFARVCLETGPHYLPSNYSKLPHGDHKAETSATKAPMATHKQAPPTTNMSTS